MAWKFSRFTKDGTMQFVLLNRINIVFNSQLLRFKGMVKGSLFQGQNMPTAYNNEESTKTIELNFFLKLSQPYSYIIVPLAQPQI